EDQIAADHQVPHRPGHEHLACHGERRHSGTDVHRHAGEIVAPDLALAGVHPGAHREPEVAALGDDRLRAPHGPAGAIEARHHAVAGRLHHAATAAVDDRTHAPVVIVEHVVPTAVAERGHVDGRVDDVGEEDCGQHAIGVGGWRAAGEELLDRLCETLARA